MKKKVFGRKLSRDKNERKALFKSLISSLVLSERIQTTESKAKAIKSEIEKLVTKAKQADESAKTVLQKNLSRLAFEKILKDIAPRFSNRQGGYVRLIKLGKRFGDDAPMAIIEWTEKAKEVAVVTPKVKKTKSKQVKPKTVKKPTKTKVIKKKSE
nr:50S ribosomal protein L17 [Candidatus Levybacteria bacterium]